MAHLGTLDQLHATRSRVVSGRAITIPRDLRADELTVAGGVAAVLAHGFVDAGAPLPLNNP